MEAELGIKFFVRDHGSVRLTVDGKELLPLIHSMSTLEQHIEQKLIELRSLSAGTVRIAVFSSILICRLPENMETFHGDHPNIDLELVTCNSKEAMEQAIYSHDVDLGFCLRSALPFIFP